MKSNKLLSSSSLTRTTLVLPLLIVATILVAGPLAMAQQITPPLTAEEQDDQNKIQDTTENVITQFLTQGQKQIGDTIFTPRWSGVTWVEPDRSGVPLQNVLPGEYAVSGEMILGRTDLAVRESYSVALPDDLMLWVLIVENQNSDDRIPG